MKQIIKPDGENQVIENDITIFLAGTIDDGNSINWQTETVDKIKCNNCTIFNPRNDNWNPKASIDDVIKQIDWEQDYLLRSDIILFNFLSKSLSPITLLELGQVLSHSGIEIFVCCPISYFRFTNVRHMCRRSNIPFFERFDDMIESLNERLEDL